MDNEGHRKRVGILTLYHDNKNFGATLQAYALQKKIEDLGFNVNVIDFIPDELLFHNKVLNLIRHPQRLRKAIHIRIRRVFPKMNTEIENEFNRLWTGKIEKWNKFCRNNIKSTEPIQEKKLLKYISSYDIYLVGSDQVWNPSYYSKAHFLPFEKNEKKKVAYAASISRPSLTEKEKKIFQNNLPDFDYITVRETEGKDLLESFLDVKVDVVLDPTLLLTMKDWNNFVEPIDLKNQMTYRKENINSDSNENGYILFMALGTNPAHRRFASRMSEYTGMRLKIISTTIEEMQANREMKGDEFLDISPGQFLYLIKNASLVITDSFHCMAFSINFRREFLALKKDSDGKTYNMNTRLYSLLDILGLKDRIVDPDSVNTVNVGTNLYAGIDEKFVDLRRRSEKKLSEMLGVE